MSTVLLLLKVVSLVAVLYIIYKAFMDSAKWGVFFLLSSVIYYFLAGYIGPVIAGAIVIGLQLYYVKNNWKEVGIPFVVLCVAWAGQLVLQRYA